MNKIINQWQFFKHREKYLKLGQPLYSRYAKDCFLFSSENKKYIDFLMSWGSIVLGHADKGIEQVIKSKIRYGLNFNNHLFIEDELAEIFSSFFSFKSKLAFFNNGSDATTSAIRIARAFTKKQFVIFSGYHGWHGWAQPNTNGILKEERVNSSKFRLVGHEKILNFINKNNKKIACIILEIPIRSKDALKVVKEIKKLSKQYKFLLIYDEIKSGLRLGFTPGISLYGIEPDILVYGKAFGGGLPFSALIVKEKVIKNLNNLNMMATFWGSPLSLYVAKYIIREFKMKDLAKNLTNISEYFVLNFNRIFKDAGIGVYLDEYYSMPKLIFKENERVMNKFYKLSFENGLYIRPNHCWFLSLSHKKDICDLALKKFSRIVKVLRK